MALANPQSTGLSPQQLDRAAGMLLGAACGDALGVPYEFAVPPGPGEMPAMKGGGLGPYAPGEYSDDTQMAVCVANVAATGADLRSDDALDQIAAGFLEWAASGATDMGAQTRAVLADARGETSSRPARALRTAAAGLHERTGRTAGNGSLMRTGVVALPYLDDPGAMAEAARAVSDLTHPDPLAGDACVLWCAAIRRAVLDATLDGLREGLELLPRHRRAHWAPLIAEAERQAPAFFSHNGFVVTALQAAWSSVVNAPVPDDEPASGTFACQHLEQALAAAIRIGDDTDTVAAIAGALLGARWGASAIPLAWVRAVHGWPGLRAPDLVRLSVLSATGGKDDQRGWPSLIHRRQPADRVEAAVPHPADDGVLLGGMSADRGQVDAVVSLCQVGREDFPQLTPEDHLQVWLVDHPGGNSYPQFVIDQAARAIARFRAEGKRVLVHCHAGQSRTPAVAARYTVLASGARPGDAFATVCAALGGPVSLVNPELRGAVYELSGEPAPPPEPGIQHPGWRNAPR
jgi:ADP-ribosylglycohydrolase